MAAIAKKKLNLEWAKAALFEVRISTNISCN
jgi:hypothetical protein